MRENTASWLITDTFRTTSSVSTAGSARARDVSVLRVFGEVDLTTHTAFDAGLRQVLGDAPDRIVVDGTSMGFCGARGLAALMSTVALAAERGIDVAVVGFSPLLQRLCGQIWPGPQPVPYSGVADAIADAAHQDAGLTRVSQVMSA